MSAKSIESNRLRYSVSRWGEGYFDIGDNGHLVVRPRRAATAQAIDLSELTAAAQAKGLQLPILFRFGDILGDRIQTLTSAFARASQELDYRGGYTAIYPIKVNQQRMVVEDILRHVGTQVGLEAGSKPELMAVLAKAPPGSQIVCNGYKDAEYLRLAMIGKRLGHSVHIVIEKLSEIELLIAEAAKLDIKPDLGLRVRLSSLGVGKWQNTGGEKAKFGLSSAQVLTAIDKLDQAQLLDCVQLLHFHLGSQIANIRDIHRGMREAARTLAELKSLGVNIRIMDVGGGLGVDYDGTRSRRSCSINYSVDQYAATILRTLAELCEEYSLEQPHVFTESGRAMTAHHAVLVTNVVDKEGPSLGEPQAPPSDAPVILHEMWQAYSNAEEQTAQETYQEAVYWIGEAHAMYAHGVINLEQRAAAERLYFATCHQIRELLSGKSRAQRVLLDELNEKLADKYFCNLSVFQSMPDIWGIEQIFPIVPLQRLDEEPTQRALLQDLTCDSDGCISTYVEAQDVESTLPAHELRADEDYLLGFFMVGAYQEILGDMHNLFGDTDSVNVEINSDGSYRFEQPERGDRADEMLSYVHFDRDDLLSLYRSKIEAAGLDEASAGQYLRELEDGLYGYTYLEK